MIERDDSPLETVGASMTKEKLVEKIKELLKTDNDLDFLLGLKKEELERLVACIRDRVDKVGG
jgi:mevalonate kinase